MAYLTLSVIPLRVRHQSGRSTRFVTMEDVDVARLLWYLLEPSVRQRFLRRQPLLGMYLHHWDDKILTGLLGLSLLNLLATRVKW
jgi:hypothetical protein